MKRCLIAGILLAAITSVSAGELYLGTTARIGMGKLRKAWKVTKAFDAAGVDETDPAVAALLDQDKLERVTKARVVLDGIEPVVGFPDAVALAGAFDAGGGIALVTIANSGNCGNWNQASARAVEVCAIIGAKPETASAKKRRAFQCKPKAGETLWGIEICD